VFGGRRKDMRTVLIYDRPHIVPATFGRGTLIKTQPGAYWEKGGRLRRPPSFPPTDIPRPTPGSGTRLLSVEKPPWKPLKITAQSAHSPRSTIHISTYVDGGLTNPHIDICGLRIDQSTYRHMWTIDPQSTYRFGDHHPRPAPFLQCVTHHMRMRILRISFLFGSNLVQQPGLGVLAVAGGLTAFLPDAKGDA